MKDRVLKLGWSCAVWAAFVLSARADSTVVFNEIMYHPATNEPGLEWVELHNQMAVDMDLSGWSLDNSIGYAFPEGTVLSGGGYMVVAVNPSALMAVTGLTNVVGPFSGRLANSGETIKLRNKDGRVMDSVAYGVDGDWPSGPDGTGVSLAKYDEASASGQSANWRMSEQVGGTPGARNFPLRIISVVSSTSVAFDAPWKFNDSGSDLGTAWRETGFDDSAWSASAALFYAGAISWQAGGVQAIPTLFSTGLGTNGLALSPGVTDPHYVLTASAYSTPPPPAIAATVMANHSAWLANDAASMWIGPQSQGTAGVPPGSYNFRTTFDLTGFDLATAHISFQVSVDNDLTAVMLNGVSVGFAYSGFNAWSSLFTVSSGFISGTNTLEFLTDNAGAAANPYGFRALVSGTALKRAATNTLVSAGPTTHYFRKPFTFTGDPTLAALRLRTVVNDGAVFYLNGVEVLRWNMPAGDIANGTPAATIITNASYNGPFDLATSALVSGTNLLAVEVHQAAGGTNDVLFGAELSLMMTNLPPPALPTLAFNEISEVTNTQFWVELVNYGQQSVTLSDGVLARFGNTSYYEYAIPSQTLTAGGHLVLDKATVGFGADPGDKVVLFARGKTVGLDSLVAKRYAQARLPEGTGAWLHPSEPTPGGTNRFAFHNEIVINEIMYHAPDLPPVPITYFTNALLSMTNVWRYSQLGQLPAAGWFASDYDDSLWPTGRALLYNTSSTLPATKNTLLSLTIAGRRIVTYYFRAPFVFSNNLAGLQLSLRHIVDEGAVFYLNGVEIYRYNLPAGSIAYNTLATSTFGVPTNAGPFLISVTNMVAGTNTLAVEVHQAATNNPVLDNDMAFGAELTAIGIAAPALPEAWVELYNRSTNTVDLTGWGFDTGIQSSFPTNKTLAPGAYLVVAGDTAYLHGIYPSLDILGDFSGSLSHSGDHLILKDPSGNPADEVRYFSGRPWPEYPAGGGTSLELRDPWADNSKAEAWAASIESGRSTWIWYTNRMVSTNVLGPTQWNEFQMGLLDAGECLIDDLHVIESPTNTPVQMLQNGDFEIGLSAWRALGDHSQSRVEVDPDNTNNHVLHLIATSATEHMHNHLETTYASSKTVTDGRLYEVSFRAKWLAGNNRLNTRLYFNRVAKTFVLSVPTLHGTPGARNSTYATNVGPTFESFGHSPVIPLASLPVTVSVNASDPQGVSAVTLWWSTNFTSWQTVSMSAGSGPASPGYVNYTGSVPGLPAGTLVQFFVQATDGLGAISTYPAGGTNSRALFKVDEGKALMTQLHRFRLLMLPSEADFLHASTNVMSNDKLGLTVVYDEREVFYDSGIHLQSSEHGRDDTTRVGFSVSMPADHLFRGVQGNITLDRSGGYSGRGGDHDEMLLWHGVNHAGGILGIECDLTQVFAPRTQEDSTAMMRLSAFDGDYFDNQFTKGGNGTLFKLELIYYPTTTATGDAQAPKLPQPDNVIGIELQDWGNDAENYRWIFLQQNHADQDDYSQMIALNQAMPLTGTNLAVRTSQLMDVDQWMRALAWKAFVCEGDTFTYGNNHNFLVYFRPEDGKALGLVWDEDYSFVTATTSPFPGTASGNTYKLVTSIPDNYRRYYNHLYDIANTTMNSAHLTPWATRYAGLLGQNWSAAVSYIQARTDYIRGFMPLNAPFSITNNNGNNFATTNDHVTLAGSAPLNVRDFQVNGLSVSVTWLSLTNWTLTVPLFAYTNLFVVQGQDNSGSNILAAIDSIIVTNTAVPALLPVVVNEWMADNAGPGGYPDPVDGAYKDWFELYNPNASSVNLSGFYLTDTLTDPTKWTIPTNTAIAAHGFLLVWADNKTNLNGQGTSGDLHANFQLSKSGEAIGLFAPDGNPQHTVTFGPQTLNVSQGLFPDGDTSAFYFMTNWTPHAANQLGAPPAPQLSTITLGAGGAVSFGFPTLANRAYRVDYKDDLSAPVWTPMSTNRTASAGTILVDDSLSGKAQRFYRSVLLE